jgi:hypothetical protein
VIDFVRRSKGRVGWLAVPRLTITEFSANALLLRWIAIPVEACGSLLTTYCRTRLAAGGLCTQPVLLQ